MKRALFASVMLWAVLPGCGEGGSFRVYVEFPDQQALEQTDRLWVVATRMPEGGGCQALMSGEARPGEGDYPAEDQITLNPNVAGGSSELDNVGPGPRLFFAEARDAQGAAILNGCTWALTGDSGENLITIQLERITECEVDRDCQLDDLWCNGEESCQDGHCLHEDQDCSHLEEQCLSVSCDEDRDSCFVVAVVDGTSCDDGLYCNDGESCLAGECQGGEPKDCSAESGACLAEPVCDEDNDVCVGEPLSEGTVCEDGLFCTSVGACDGQGACVGAPRDCSALDSQCTRGICDEEANACAAEPAFEGEGCDDGLFCTAGDSCDSGACSGTPRDCADDDACTQDICDEILDQCRQVWVPNPGAEGLAVTGTCDDSEDNDCDHDIDLDDPDCQPCQQDSDCDDGDVCTTNSCNAEHQCESTAADGVGCDDGVNCTTGDVCADRLCAGQPVSCSQLDSECSLGVCNEADGACLAQPINQGQACTDEFYCSMDSTCSGVECSGGTGRDCSMHTDACNIGVCNEQTDLCEPAPRPANTPCDDGAYCNGDDQCDGLGTCVHSGDPCLAGSECSDSCSELGEHCHAPAGSPCGDASDTACDEPDSCDGAGTCQTNLVPGGTFCEDGEYCNGVDTCDGAGTCLHSGDPCQGSSECTDVCNETDDDCEAPTGTPCGEPTETECNAADTCDDSGTCQANLASAGTPCGDQSDTACDDPDTCSGSGECQPNPNPLGTFCDDGLYCTGTDTCDGGGNCQHTGDPCGIGTICDEDNNTCQAEVAPVLSRIAAGGIHSCGLTAEGVAWCWGSDSAGQLGNGSSSGSTQSPMAVDVSTMTGEIAFVSLAAGNAHTCGLTAEGVAWCWGYNLVGQLGNGGSSGDVHSPVKVDTTNMTGDKAFVLLVAGDNHTCGLTAEGAAWCWGSDDNGQLGDGGVSFDAHSPVAVDTGAMTGEKAFVDLTAGGYHTCGITAEGVAWCWGRDHYGQLGDGGASADSQKPELVDVGPITGETAFVQLVAGWHHTCGLTAQGQAWCWGRDNHGQLGVGGSPNSYQSPMAVDTSQMDDEKAFVELTTGQFHSCGLDAKGRVWCWGYDNSGQQGNGQTMGDVNLPVAVDVTPVTGSTAFTGLSAGVHHTCALTAEGVPWCWGWDAYGQLGDGGTASNAQSPVAVDTSAMPGELLFASLVTGQYHACGLTNDGRAWCWGEGSDGQLGTGWPAGDSQNPVAVDTTTMSGETAFVQLAAGVYHTCGLTAEGLAWCWGDDNQGQLGNGDALGGTSSPGAVDTSTMTGEKAFVQLTAAFLHSCGLTARGLVWCWGSDSGGMLGDGGGQDDSQSPVAVSTTTMTGEMAFVQLESGTYHTCGLTAEGKVWCWGNDDYGQLGNGGPNQDSESPVTVAVADMPGEKAFAVLAGGYNHACGITARAVAWCWGSNADYQLGIGSPGPIYPSPEPVDTSTMTGEKSFVSLTAGGYHSCGTSAEGVGWCWGKDEYGQLGDGGTSTNAPSPVILNTSSMTGEKAWQSIWATGDYGCGLTGEGIAWCWGSDGNGQLGDGGSSSDSQSPVPVDTSGM